MFHLIPGYINQICILFLPDFLSWELIISPSDVFAEGIHPFAYL